MLREIILDTETTGLDPRDGHRIIEIGCLELINHFPSGSTFHQYLDPERDVPKEAEAVHGISSAMVRGKPLFAAIAGPFLEFIADDRLVIHNAGFDMGFVNAELAKAGHKPIGMDRVIDTLALARRKHPGAPASLDALCKRYQIDNSRRDKHGALLDSELLAEVYLELIGGHQTKLELVSAQARETAGTGGASRRKRRAAAPQRPSPLPPRLTEAEIAAHRAFIATLKDPLWNTILGDKKPVE